MRYILGLSVLIVSILLTLLDFYIPDITDLTTLKDIGCIQLPLMTIYLPKLCRKVDPNEKLNLDINHQLDRCLFCDFAKVRRELVYEDEKYIAFDDINPSGEKHFLVITREHIGNNPIIGSLIKGSILNLEKKDVQILKDMNVISNNLLSKYVNATNMRIGFHVPPFTTVQHIHMHAISTPLKNRIRWLKYPDGWLWNRWWINTERLVQSIERREFDEGKWDWSWV